MPTPPSLSPASPSPQTPWQPHTPDRVLDVAALESAMQRHVSNAQGTTGKAPENEILEWARSDHCASRMSTQTIVPEFSWQEEPVPRSPPSRLSFYTHSDHDQPEREEDENDETTSMYSIYSQFTSTYSFQSQAPTMSSRRGTGSIRRRPSSRSDRRSTAMSMMSVYSQASFVREDTKDLPPIPLLPWALKPESVGGQSALHAQSHPYAAEQAERTSVVMGDAAISSTPLPAVPSIPSSPISPTLFSDDWRALLAGRNPKPLKRQPSVVSALSGTSNTSVVDVALPPHKNTELIKPNSSESPLALVPNRRQRTIRRPTTTLVPPVVQRQQLALGENEPVRLDPDVEKRLRAGLHASKQRDRSPGLGTSMLRLKNRLTALTIAPRSGPTSTDPSSQRPSEPASAVSHWLTESDAHKLQSNMLHFSRHSLMLPSKAR
ncbi:hypothetical protein MKEN_00816700 [Mycena kentingensis (nom. inval.)]|nr:hypothetical protein MKEN_00816700 [Mycena kentingensis (nom. inval.)]